MTKDEATWRCSHGWLRGEQCEICKEAMNKDKALKLALEIALEKEYQLRKTGQSHMIEPVITAIKEALAPTSTQCEVQPEQEPVKWAMPQGWWIVESTPDELNMWPTREDIPLYAKPWHRASSSSQEPVAIELALAGLVEKITGGFDSGDLLADAVTASKMLDAQPKQPISVQPEQEPLGFMNAGHVHEMQQGRLPYGYVYPKGGVGADIAVYTTPPKRPWVGLTPDEIMEIGRELGLKCRLGGNPNIDFDYANAIEAKLKSKNA